jgi:hypothetical protein
MVAQVKSTSKALPGDCTILPLSRGGLLVSHERAVFCPIPSFRRATCLSTFGLHG